MSLTTLVKTDLLHLKAFTVMINPINLINVEEIARTSQGEKPQINLTALGYTKLLGTGKVTKPLTIQVASYSKSAAEKIKEAGGEIISSQANGE